jgi:hypothetical protein
MDAQRDTQRCQNHGPVRLLVPLLEFNQIGSGRVEIWYGGSKGLGTVTGRNRCGPLTPEVVRSVWLSSASRGASSKRAKLYWSVLYATLTRQLVTD